MLSCSVRKVGKNINYNMFWLTRRRSGWLSTGCCSCRQVRQRLTRGTSRRPHSGNNLERDRNRECMTYITPLCSLGDWLVDRKEIKLEELVIGHCRLEYDRRSTKFSWLPNSSYYSGNLLGPLASSCCALYFAYSLGHLG